MTTISAFEARTRFGELLRMVRGGEEVLITWRDIPVARVIPEGRDNPAERAALADRILASRAGCVLPAEAVRVNSRELIDEGRRF